jgi:hypothetical protein
VQFEFFNLSYSHLLEKIATGCAQQIKILGEKIMHCALLGELSSLATSSSSPLQHGICLPSSPREPDDSIRFPVPRTDKPAHVHVLGVDDSHVTRMVREPRFAEVELDVTYILRHRDWHTEIGTQRLAHRD